MLANTLPVCHKTYRWRHHMQVEKKLPRLGRSLCQKFLKHSSELIGHLRALLHSVSSMTYSHSRPHMHNELAGKRMSSLNDIDVICSGWHGFSGIWETRAKRKAKGKRGEKYKKRKKQKGKREFVLISTQSDVKWASDLALHLRGEEQLVVCMLWLKLITVTAGVLSSGWDRTAAFFSSKSLGKMGCWLYMPGSRLRRFAFPKVVYKKLHKEMKGIEALF